MPNFRHYCKEWDFLEIDADDDEFEACICEIDIDGKGPQFRSGDRVRVKPNGLMATVEKQYLSEGNHWGNVLLVYDDGIGGISNSWQLERVEL